MKEYSLFRTDNKTFFEFRSDPKSRCEGFTVTYCDDGTVVMTGDYGTLCWKRNYNRVGNEENFRPDYGFPGKETDINYFAEKVSQFGIKQKIKEWILEKVIERFKEVYSEEEEDLGNGKTYAEALEEIESLEHYDEIRFHEIVREYDIDAWECEWETYSDQFKFMFKLLCSVSDKIYGAVQERKK